MDIKSTLKIPQFQKISQQQSPISQQSSSLDLEFSPSLSTEEKELAENKCN